MKIRQPVSWIPCSRQSGSIDKRGCAQDQPAKSERPCANGCVLLSVLHAGVSLPEGCKQPMTGTHDASEREARLLARPHSFANHHGKEPIFIRVSRWLAVQSLVNAYVISSERVSCRTRPNFCIGLDVDKLSITRCPDFDGVQVTTLKSRVLRAGSVGAGSTCSI